MPRFKLDRSILERLDDLLDPGAGLWFSRQLEYILPTVLRERPTNLSGLKLFTKKTDIPVGAKSFTQRMFTTLGVAQWIENYSQDLPRVGVAAREETFQTKRMGASFGWSYDELQAAMFAKTNLSASEGIAARRALEEKHNKTIWLGDENVGLHGVLTYPYIPHVIMAQPISSSASTTAALIRTLFDLIDTVYTVTKETATATRLMMPTEAYTYIATTPRSDYSDMTILKWIQEAKPGLSILSVPELSNSYHALGYDRYVVDSPGVINAVFPGDQVYVQEDVQQKNLEYLVNAHGKSGGVVSDFPLEAAIGISPS